MEINPNKLNITKVMDSFRNFGISQLDSELLADCINVQKSCSWQNNDEISEDAIAKTKEFLLENKLGITVQITPSKYGKFIWETTKIKD